MIASRKFPAPRVGLTTIEVLMAIMLLGVGAVATLSVHASITRMSAHAHHRRLLALDATRVLDSLRAITCTTVAPGSLVRRHGRLDWTARAASSSITVTLSAVPTSGVAWHAETILPCV
ncbi:MAG: type IV pilus modification PilV family protein [Gemmatimonadaceae bacterium]